MKHLIRKSLIFVFSVAACVFLVRAWSGVPEALAQFPAASSPAQEQSAPEAPLIPSDCSSPRNAVGTLFYWTTSGHVDLSQASLCLERRGRTPGELRDLAGQTRNIFNERGLSVDPDSFSDDPDWVSPSSGKESTVLHSALPQLRLERDAEDRWMIPHASLNQVKFLSKSTELLSPELIARLPDSLRVDIFGVEGWQLLSLFFVIIVGLLVRKTIQFLLLRRLARVAKHLGATSAGHVVDVFAGPGSALAMAGILALFYPQLGLPFFATVALSIVVRSMVVLSVVLSLYRLVDVAADRMASKAALTDSKLDDQLVPLLRRALKIIVIVAGVLFFLQNINVNVGSLLAGLGIGGVAIALAAKDTIANFFGSVMIFIDRPFQIGDWVKIGDTEGIVEEVGFRSTRVRTFYNSRVTVPNAHFTEAAIDNMGMRTYRRTFTTLGLTYDTTPAQMQAFVEGIRAIILANEYSRKDYYEIHFSGFGAHSLDVMVYIFFKVESWTAELRERHNVYMEILRLAHALGVQFALPTQTLHLSEVALPGAERHVPAPKVDSELANVVRAFGPQGELSRPASPYLADGYVAGTTRRAGG